METKHQHVLVFYLLQMLLLVVCSCNANNLPGRATPGNAPGDQEIDPATFVYPFTAVSSRSALEKIKTILTGETLLEDELTSVTQNNLPIQALIKNWQKSPLYEQKMIAFLSKAFQQDQSNGQAFAAQGIELGGNLLQPNERNKLLRNLQESFARTILALDNAGEPFATFATTKRFMMTSALIAYYTCLDDTLVGENRDQNAPKTRSGTGIGGFGGFLQSLGEEGFSDWHLVEIEQVAMDAPSHSCSALADAVGATTLRLVRPRIGFFTTPSFFANWQTNVGNQFRVTANQSMIVAVGKPFQIDTSQEPQDISAIDAKHIHVNTPCYACHVNMDPIRQVFRQVYDIHYGVQPNPEWQKATASFAFAGVTSDLSGGLPQFAAILADHPLLTKSWLLQLCNYASSTLCADDDPEIARLEQVWRARNLSFSALIEEVFASPLVTYLAPTKTAGLRGQAFPIMKRNHLCNVLATRLHLPALCSNKEAVGDKQPTATNKMRTILGMIPEDTYQRGSAEPLQANDPSMFMFSGVENFCADLSGLVLGNVEHFDSSKPDEAILAMVQQLMGIPTLEQQPWIDLLQSHYQQALQVPVKPNEALQTTFMVACMSPAVMGMGF